MKEDLIPIIESMAEVWNDHDLEGTLDFYADDAVVKLPLIAPGKNLFTGKNEIRLWLEETFNGDIHITNIRDYRVKGDTITWGHDLHLKPFAELGLDPAHAIAEATFRDGKIVLFHGRLDDESTKIVEQAMAARHGA